MNVVYMVAPIFEGEIREEKEKDKSEILKDLLTFMQEFMDENKHNEFILI